MYLNFPASTELRYVSPDLQVKTFAQLLPGHLVLADQDKLGDFTCDFTRDFARPSPDRGDEAMRHSRGWGSRTPRELLIRTSLALIPPPLEREHRMITLFRCVELSGRRTARGGDMYLSCLASTELRYMSPDLTADLWDAAEAIRDDIAAIKPLTVA